MDYPLRRGMIDSHFHGLIMREKGIAADSLIHDLVARGFAGGIDVSVSPEDLPDRLDMYRGEPRVLLSTGIHPGRCGHSDTKRDLELLRRQIHDRNRNPGVLDARETRIVAVGEMGLDWYRGQDHRREQTEVFSSQLEIAASHDLPVIIHNREADDDILARVDDVLGVRGVMHCFSSGPEFARQCVDRGFYISFAGNVTYKRSGALRLALCAVPRDRLLLETDSPFLAPQAVRGKPNHPGFVSFTYQFVADLLEIPIDELVATVFENFAELFGRDVDTESRARPGSEG